MNPRVHLIIVSLAVFAIAACSERAPPVKGFYLPPGDAALGQQVFTEYKCFSCHEIPDVALPQREVEPPFVVTLGGKIQAVNNYGELLTAVLMPDHKLSRDYLKQLKAAEKEVGLSPMPYFGDEMTVTELVNLVEFLNGQYTRLLPEDYTGYIPQVL
jgi:hypothetical protein